MARLASDANWRHAERVAHVRELPAVNGSSRPPGQRWYLPVQGKRTRWGYGVMATGISAACYGLLGTAFIVAYAPAMNFD